MKKYWIIIKNEFQRQLTYRVNTIIYGFGNVFELLIFFVVWSAVYKNTSVIQGYTFQEMITYLVVGWFFAYFTANYELENVIAKDINSGMLSNFISKPISYLRFISMRSVGRITISTTVIIISLAFLIIFFRSNIIFSMSFSKFAIILIMIVVSYILKMFIAILIGLIAFWTMEVTGIYYSLGIFIRFFSGNYFPIILLPASLVSISEKLPFIYTQFIPVQYYLGKIGTTDAIKGIIIELIWLAILYGIIKIVWKYGIKRYESAGI